MKLPSNRTLIFGAICFSLVASIGAYKIGEARRIALEEQKKAGGYYVDIDGTTAEMQTLQKTLRQINFDEILSSSTAANAFAPSENDTLTDAFAKNIFLSYSAIENGNDERTDAQVAADVVAGIDTSSLPKNPYTLGNVNVYVARNKAEIKDYGNTVGAIIKDNYTIIANKKSTIKLAEIASIHKKIGEQIIGIPVPTTLSNQHLALANSFGLLGDSFAVIASQEKKDPLRALLSIRTAQDASENLNSSFKEINNYFIKNDILFNNDEPGVIWSHIVFK